MIQTMHVCGRTLEPYNPELSDLVHWNRISVGCLVMHKIIVTSDLVENANCKRFPKAQVTKDRI